MLWSPSEAVNIEQWLAGELPTPRSFCPLWRGTEPWMCGGRLDRGWEPMRTEWAGAKASLDPVGGLHSPQRIASRV